jgi:hypothetical protein
MIPPLSRILRGLADDLKKRVEGTLFVEEYDPANDPGNEEDIEDRRPFWYIAQQVNTIPGRTTTTIFLAVEEPYTDEATGLAMMQIYLPQHSRPHEKMVNGRLKGYANLQHAVRVYWTDRATTATEIE